MQVTIGFYDIFLFYEDEALRYSIPIENVRKAESAVVLLLDVYLKAYTAASFFI